MVVDRLISALELHLKKACGLRGVRDPEKHVGKYTITYSDLAANPDVKLIARGLGPFLTKVAEVCAARGWPPLHALVVSKQTGRPGARYNQAANSGSTPDEWPGKVAECVLSQVGRDNA